MSSKLEERTRLLQTFLDAMDRVPRLAELFGMAVFAGRASERAGGRFIDGAMAGMVADGLAHSNLPNNQIGGVALGTYIGGVGLLNVAPPMMWESAPQTTEPEPEQITGDSEPTWLDWWGNFLFPPRPESWS